MKQVTKKLISFLLVEFFLYISISSAWAHPFDSLRPRAATETLVGELERTTENQAARDGSGKNRSSFTWSEFSLEGERRKGETLWKGTLRTGGEEFLVTLGTGEEAARFEVHDPQSGVMVAYAEWFRGERPWLQRIEVNPEFRGPGAIVRLADVLMAIQLSDMAAYGSSFDHLWSSVALRREGGRPNSFGVFRLLEQIGLRPDSEILEKWADRVQGGTAKLELQQQLGYPWVLEPSTPHLRISWSGGEYPRLFEQPWIELFLKGEDGQVLAEGDVYRRLSTEPRQVEEILRGIAGGIEAVTVEGKSYSVWMGGVEYHLDLKQLPSLRATIASLPPVPWALSPARDGGAHRVEMPSRLNLVPSNFP